MVNFFFQNNLQNKLSFLILDFQRIMNSCEFKEIIVFKDFHFVIYFLLFVLFRDRIH
jgi:hypothetical protein